MAEPRLPLFERTDLNSLQQRREALLKRVQGLKKQSHRRAELLDRLKLLTADQMRLEIRMGDYP